MQPLRVIHVIPSLIGGGAERQVALLARTLARKQVDVHIAYLHDGQQVDQVRRMGAEMHRLRVMGNHDPRALTELLLLVRRIRPSVLQTWLLHADVFGGAAALLSRTPWVLSERASALAYAHGRKNALRRFVGQRASAVVANSVAGMRYWRESGYRGEALVIRNIVEAPSESVDVQRSRPAGSPSILIVGRLTDQKDPKVVLQVLERVFAEQFTARAHFLGVGPMEEELRQRVANSSLMRGRVEFHGFVRDIETWYQDAQVCLSMSRFEGNPNSVLEAMRYGCPLVVTDIPEHLELLDATTALLTPVGDPDAAANRVMNVLSNQSEARRRSELAKGRLRDYGADNVGREYIELYQRLAEG